MIEQNLDISLLQLIEIIFFKYSKLMDTEKKKFDDIRKPLENVGYDIVKMIGKGAFGEVILVKDSKYVMMI